VVLTRNFNWKLIKKSFQKSWKNHWLLLIHLSWTFIRLLSQLFDYILKSYQLNKNYINYFIKLSFYLKVFLPIKCIMLLDIDYRKVNWFNTSCNSIFSQAEMMSSGNFFILMNFFKNFGLSAIKISLNLTFKSLPIHYSFYKFESRLNVLVKLFVELFFEF